MAGEYVAACSPRFRSTAIRTASSTVSRTGSAGAAPGNARAPRVSSAAKKSVMVFLIIPYSFFSVGTRNRVKCFIQNRPGGRDAKTARGCRDPSPLLRDRLRRRDRPQRRQAHGETRNKPRGDQG